MGTRIRLAGLAALVLLCTLLPSGSATGQGNPPFTDRTKADFSLEVVKSHVKECQGQDGQYVDIRNTYEGESDGDPRLTGEMTLTAHALVRVNPDAGPFLPDTGTAGQAEGTYHVVGDGSRAQGRFFATIGGTFPSDPTSNNLEIEGIAVGPVQSVGQATASPTDLEGGELIGNFRASSSPDPAGSTVEGTLGGTGTPAPPRDPNLGAGEPDTLESPAFIQAGNCPGTPAS